MQKADHDRLRLYDFVCRVRLEFEPVRAQLLSRSPRPMVTEALLTFRAEELRRGLAAQFVPVVFATPSSSTTPTVFASTTVPPQVSVYAPVFAPTGVQCNYCKNFRHDYQSCAVRKRRNKAREGGRSKGGLGGPSSTGGQTSTSGPSQRGDSVQQFF